MAEYTPTQDGIVRTIRGLFLLDLYEKSLIHRLYEHMKEQEFSGAFDTFVKNNLIPYLIHNFRFKNPKLNHYIDKLKVKNPEDPSYDPRHLLRAIKGFMNYIYKQANKFSKRHIIETNLIKKIK